MKNELCEQFGIEFPIFAFSHCRDHVAGYKVPKELHLVPEVVRSPSGKPDYPWAGKVARGEIKV